MDSIQKRVGIYQGVFFLAVVGLLFLPYVLLTLEMTWSQIRTLLIIYAWEAPFVGIICIGLPMRWVNTLLLAREKAGKKASLKPSEIHGVISRGLKLPLKIAWTTLFVILLGFMIGILQMIMFADFDAIQSVETLIIGIMIAIIYAACCFFNNERILAPRLGSWVKEFGMSDPPRVLTLFNKLLVVCLSIMVVTILFQGSVTFSHSNRLVEGLEGEGSISELVQLKTILEDLNVKGREKEVERILSKASKPEDLDFFVLHRSGKVPLGEDGELLHQQSTDHLRSVYSDLRKQVDSGTSITSHEQADSQIIYYGLPLGNQDLLLVKVIEFETIRDEMTSLLISILISSIVVLFIAFYLSYRLAENAATPLRNLEEVADRIATGDISYPIDVITGDEIGVLACSFLRMQRELSRLSHQAGNIAQGDLRSRVEFHGDLADAFNQMQTDLNDIIFQVKDAILKISTACNQILASSEEQASGASEQAASVGETTASIEELSTTAGQIAENSDIQAGMAESTQQNAVESAKAMDEAAALMESIQHHTEKGAEQIMSLGEKSQQIGKVLAIINEVAAETKMLSLNAAIEASKAGEAGKGFSVVATEIRKLAENVVRSTGSIEEIAREIQTAANSSVMAAEENVKLVKVGAQKLTRVEEAMQEIVSMAEQTTDSAKQVSMATGQQKNASEQIVLTMRELSDVAKQMAAAAGETTSSANSLTQMTENLKKIVSRFRLEV